MDFDLFFSFFLLCFVFHIFPSVPDKKPQRGIEPQCGSLGLPLLANLRAELLLFVPACGVFRWLEVTNFELGFLFSFLVFLLFGLHGSFHLFVGCGVSVAPRVISNVSLVSGFSILHIA